MTHSALASLFCLGSLSFASGAAAIDPPPHQIRSTGVSTSLSPQAGLTGAESADPAAVAAIKATLARLAPGGKITRIVFGTFQTRLTTVEVIHATGRPLISP